MVQRGGADWTCLRVRPDDAILYQRPTADSLGVSIGRRFALSVGPKSHPLLHPRAACTPSRGGMASWVVSTASALAITTSRIGSAGALYAKSGESAGVLCVSLLTDCTRSALRTSLRALNLMWASSSTAE
jgi:hypothetical protein